ncbi:MAG: MarR family winged helix-turn-helix transcriptional regulator [Burkholderiaceae bacterium]
MGIDLDGDEKAAQQHPLVGPRGRGRRRQGGAKIRRAEVAAGSAGLSEPMTTPPDDLHDLSHRPGFLLRKAHQVAVAIFSQEVGDLGLTPPQHNVLSALMANPGCHQTELGRIVGYDRATVGAVLSGLEARALVERKDSPRDRRLKTLTITRKGRHLLNQSNSAMEKINQRILEPLAAHERPLFVALLARIAFIDPQSRHEDQEPERR